MAKQVSIQISQKYLKSKDSEGVLCYVAEVDDNCISSKSFLVFAEKLKNLIQGKYAEDNVIIVIIR